MIPIQFFTPEENIQAQSKSKKPAKPIKLEGYISSVGKIVIPTKTMGKLEIDSTRFQIGTDQGKRKIKVIYLVPTQHENSFELIKAAKSYTIDLSTILQKVGIDYKSTKYSFTISAFDYQEGITGYKLTLQSDKPKVPYTGKPRGRKAKVADQAE